VSAIIGFTAYQETRHFSGLDGLRCLSILSVMYFHYSGADNHLGKLGVDLFFILSGFLITTLLLRERQQNGTINLKYFWLRRVLRIFPVYYGFIFAQLVIFQFIPFEAGLAEGFYRDLPAFLTFTNNWFVHLSDERRVVFYHAWSLAAEEQFYLFWPPLVAASLSTRRLIAIPSMLILFDLAATYGVQSGWINLGMDGNSVITCLQPAICFGVIAAVIMHNRTTFDSVAKALKLPGFASAMLLAATILIALDSWRPAVYLVLTGMLTSLVFNTDRILGTLLNLKPVVFIGQISYGMYIFHMAAFNAVKILIFQGSAADSWPVISSAFFLTIVVAACSFYCYEKPIMGLRYKISPMPG